jgi:hypothetical protein
MNIKKQNKTIEKFENMNVKNNINEGGKMNVKNFFERRIVKILGVAFVFLLLGLSMIMAGTVVVKDGDINVPLENDICIGGVTCLSDAGRGDIIDVTEDGTTPLTFTTDCDGGGTGICFIGMDPLTAADLEANSVGDDELIDNPTFSDVTVGDEVGSGRLKIPVYNSGTPPSNPAVGEIWIELP